MAFAKQQGKDEIGPSFSLKTILAPGNTTRGGANAIYLLDVDALLSASLHRADQRVSDPGRSCGDSRLSVFILNILVRDANYAVVR